MIRFHNTNQRGFTIIELMLAMGGIAFLLLFVLFAMTHATNLYSKGVALRQINQVGRQTGEEIAKEIRYGGKPVYDATRHRLCIGSKSYVWNNADMSITDSNYNKKSDGSGIGFIRLDGAGYCSTPSAAIPNNAQELLGNVATLMSMDVSQPVPGSSIYKVTMVYGTKLTPPQLVSGRYQCTQDGGQFCAVGEFDITVYARGENYGQ